MSIISTRRHTSPHIPKIKLGEKKQFASPPQLKKMRLATAALNEAAKAQDEIKFRFALSEAYRLLRDLNREFI